MLMSDSALDRGRMAVPRGRHWTRPQTIPRGLLRTYILATLSRGPVTGYDILSTIEEETEGAWRPGPGTIYPLLRCLMEEGLVTASEKRSRTSRVSYTITPAGANELARMKSEMASFGRKMRVVLRLLSDLVPNQTLVPSLLDRARESSEFLKSKIAELPEPDRTAALRELGTMAENDLDWVRSAHRTPKNPMAKRSRAR